MGACKIETIYMSKHVMKNNQRGNEEEDMGGQYREDDVFREGFDLLNGEFRHKTDSANNLLVFV